MKTFNVPYFPIASMRGFLAPLGVASDWMGAASRFGGNTRKKHV